MLFETTTTGAQADDDKGQKRSMKVSQPPGGKSSGLWWNGGGIWGKLVNFLGINGVFGGELVFREIFGKWEGNMIILVDGKGIMIYENVCFCCLH